MPTKPLSSSSHQGLFSSFFKILSFLVKPFWVELGYFMIFSFLGFLALNVTKPRTLPSFRPHNLDVFFTSVSATTVSSMSTVEMEVFSNAQLVFMTILMFLGGEAFTSFLRLQLMKLKLVKKHSVLQNNDAFDYSNSSNGEGLHNLELGTVGLDNKLEHAVINPMEDGHHEAIAKLKSIRLLTYVVLGYILVVILLGSSLVSIYITFIPSAKQILNEKGLNLHTFSIFTTVSTFANCGFVPTNENMMVFKQNSGLLLILIPQILLGNTLYAPSLRFVIWFLWKFTKRQEFEYILKNSKRVGYSHIFPRFETIAIAVTVLAFISVQFVAFCSLEWNSEAAAGLSTYQKLVGSLFEVVNTRHTGQSVFDISTFTPAIIVLFALMMYLSSYTTFLPVDNHEERLKTKEKINRKKRRSLVKYISFSQPSCLVIFTILICVVEKDKTKNDPLNFNVLNIAFEVISAYGTVGMSMGYSCARQMKPDGHCKDTTYGFAGKWSNTGKFLLIIVMFFGRMKKYNQRGGKAWKVL
ncbi:putative LRR receptor-like serine/threonine-protein kinase-like [Capsicum annuum]|uniref:sodium transporter HKT1 n=1 Tax=Capsicum annuum TaxID=4072 RepID=UPI001FB0A8FA|nr:sodium transporter HKT1 [Capsicum annuum]XP_047259866.1 sodium transporter HKT1 [Capsicum annuum]KAF3619919.1 putative LRR receptor-like serine/threonine-protein kinase-like [Capsicum annuum]